MPDRIHSRLSTGEQLGRIGARKCHGETNADADAALAGDAAKRLFKGHGGRDLSQHGGFPLGARPGPGGGYVVDAAASLPPINCTDAELSGLAAAVAAHRGQPFDGHARTALAKALSVMDTPSQECATALNMRVWIDHNDDEGGARARHSIGQALRGQRVLVMHYRDWHGQQTIRHVDPVLLAFTRVRWFRLDRVAAARLTVEPAADF